MKVILDANDAVLGRVASFAAKQALLGKEVIVLNCAESLLTGRKNMILDEYKKLMFRGGHSLKGPFHRKHEAERIVKRTIRGMLAHKQQRGRDALKRVRCYDEIPAEYSQEKPLSLKRSLSVNAVKLKELVRIL